MKIKRIRLKNFKNHTNSEYSFAEGINLILGPNGAGKSSIFEAIGIAMFGVKSLRSFRDYVKIGEKRAEIEIEFEGNDELNYVVSRQIGDSSHYELYLSDNSGKIKVTGNKDVSMKIAEFCGIDPSNVQNIYTNIICGYQNNITNAFNQTPENRKKLFERIFDVEIYQSIYSELQPIISTGYRLKLEEARVKIQDKTDVLSKEYDNLDGELSKLEEKLLLLDQKVESLKKRRDKKEKEILKIKDEIDNMNKIKERIKNLEEYLERYRKDLKDKERELLKVIDAQKIVENNRESFEEYQRLFERLRQLDENIALLERDDKKRQELESLLKDYQKEIEKQENEISIYEENINEKLSKIKVYEKQIEEKEEKIKEYTIERERLQKKLRDLKMQEEELKVKREEKIELENEYLDFERINRDKTATEERLKVEIEKLKNLELKIEELRNDVSTLEVLDNELKKLEIKKEFLLTETLKQGICPILDKECIYLSALKDENYFLNKSVEIEREMSGIMKKRSRLDKKSAELKELENERSGILRAIEILRENLDKLDQILKQKNGSQLKNRLDKLKNVDSDYEFVRSKIKEHEELISELTFKERSEVNDIGNKHKEIEKLKNEIKIIKNRIQELKRKKNENSKKLKDIESELSALGKKVEKFQNLKQKRVTISERLKSLEPSRDAYLKNKSLANEKEEVEEKISNLRDEIKIKKDEIERLRKELSRYDYTELQKELVNANKERDALEFEYEAILNQRGEAKEKKKYVEERLKKRETLESEIKELKDREVILNRKLKLLEEYRKNIKNMGTFVAKEITKRVGLLATEYYRKITGKFEEICWESGDSYEVYLLKAQGAKRPYRMLSGGEQMSVAISLRLALAKVYSDARILILDEPTSNLDEEKKQSLASAIKFIAKDLDQVFVVTHDKTFIEMSQKEIIVQ